MQLQLCLVIKCSVLGHKVGRNPAAHFYSATKFALRAVTEGIQVELRSMKSGIKVTVSNVYIVEALHYVLKFLRKFLQD